jgi:hypothetical protein
VLDQPPARLHQPLLQAAQRPLLDPAGQHQAPPAASAGSNPFPPLCGAFVPRSDRSRNRKSVGDTGCRHYASGFRGFSYHPWPVSSALAHAPHNHQPASRGPKKTLPFHAASDMIPAIWYWAFRRQL